MPRTSKLVPEIKQLDANDEPASNYEAIPPLQLCGGIRGAVRPQKPQQRSLLGKKIGQEWCGRVRPHPLSFEGNILAHHRRQSLAPTQQGRKLFSGSRHDLCAG